MGGNPVGQPLAQGRRGEGVVRRPQHGDEDLGGVNRPGLGIDEIDAVAGVVHEQPLAGGVDLPQGRRHPPRPGPIAVAKPGIAEAVGMLGPVLLPEQQQGDTRPPQVAMQGGPIRLRPLVGRNVGHGREQKPLQFFIAERVGQRPSQSGLLGAGDVLAHGGGADPGDGRNLTLGQAAREGEPEDLSDLAHGHSLRRHLAFLVAA